MFVGLFYCLFVCKIVWKTCDLSCHCCWINFLLTCTVLHWHAWFFYLCTTYEQILLHICDGNNKWTCSSSFVTSKWEKWVQCEVRCGCAALILSQDTACKLIAEMHVFMHSFKDAWGFTVGCYTEGMHKDKSYLTEPIFVWALTFGFPLSWFYSLLRSDLWKLDKLFESQIHSNKLFKSFCIHSVHQWLASHVGWIL